MWVLDATPLIYLAKAERLDLLERLDRPRLVPERVYDEVVTAGLEEGYPDARRIERRVEAGGVEIGSPEASDPFDRLAGNPNLSDADAAVLALATEVGGTAVMDEAYGRDVADTEGIETRGTAYLLCLLVERGRADASEARETVDAMVEAGWYCAPDDYARIVRTIESLG